MRIKCIDKKYNGRKILDNIDLTFDKCGLVYILGQSGAGKSTLLNIIGMLDPEYDGELAINATPIEKTEKVMSKYRSEMIGFVFQEFNLINSLSVKDNIIISLELSRKDFNQDEYDIIMKKLDLLHLEDRDVATLSGGEKQRVAIARAIVRGSRIILADEPTGNLDAYNSANIMLALKEISKDRLVIIVTHSEYFAKKYGDRILYIKEKAIVSDEDLGYSDNKSLDEFIDSGAKKLDLKAKRYMKLSWMNFRLRKDRIILIIVSMTIAMLCLSAVLGILSGTGNLISDVNKSILELDKIIVKNYSNKFFHTIDNSLFAEITDSVECSKVIPFYDTKIDLSYNNKSLETKIEMIDTSDFFRERFDIIKGRNINQINEILIDKTVEATLFGEIECIGKKVEMKTDTGFIRICEIAGIYDMESAVNESKIYMTKELNAALSRGTLAEPFLLGYADEDMDRNIMFKIKTSDENNKIIIDDTKNGSGGIPQVLVNVAGFNNLISKITPQCSPIAIDDINRGKIPEQIKESIFGQIITLQKLDMIVFGKVRIAGICTEKEPSDSLVFYLSDENAE
ncbi:MAG: ABC transporter ATP-binding protein/permease, partial [Saccharofermentanales bacterium]